MNYIIFNVILLFAGFFALLIFSIGLMACLAPIGLFVKSENTPKISMIPFITISVIYHIYFWVFWSAFCIAMIIRFTHKPEVTWDWLYWITGFIECISLIGFLSYKEQQGSQSPSDVRGIRKGKMLYSLVAIVAFFVFAFAPSLMLWPYGWALKPLGLAFNGLTSSEAQVESPPILDYVDDQYQFAFKFPADWKLEKKNAPGEAGEIRAMVRHPSKQMYVMATVSHIGKTITRSQFDSSQNRDAMVEGMMELTVEQVYKKASQDLGIERTIVSEKRAIPSDSGIKFYISTAQIKGSMTMIMAGIHILPFDKPYMIAFLMVTPMDRTATKDNDTITQILNSFHVLGERPIK